MIIQPWPPDGTIITTPAAAPDRRGRPRTIADPAQLVDELRTIATCVLGFTELLRGETLVDQDRRAYLGVLHEQATRLAGIVECLDRSVEGSSDALPKLPG